MGFIKDIVEWMEKLCIYTHLTVYIQASIFLVTRLYVDGRSLYCDTVYTTSTVVLVLLLVLSVLWCYYIL